MQSSQVYSAAMAKQNTGATPLTQIIVKSRNAGCSILKVVVHPSFLKDTPICTQLDRRSWEICTTQTHPLLSTL